MTSTTIIAVLLAICLVLSIACLVLVMFLYKRIQRIGAKINTSPREELEKSVKNQPK